VIRSPVGCFSEIKGWLWGLAFVTDIKSFKLIGLVQSFKFKLTHLKEHLCKGGLLPFTQMQELLVVTKI
jgi:hypothetical protein